jgi:hypothetical protein
MICFINDLFMILLYIYSSNKLKRVLSSSSKIYLIVVVCNDELVHKVETIMHHVELMYVIVNSIRKCIDR